MRQVLTVLAAWLVLFVAHPANAQTYPRPYIADISPKSVSSAAVSFTVTVRGSGLVNGVSQIYWNGVALAGTTCAAASAPTMASCSATVPAARVAVGTAAVTVVNPGVPLALVSNSQALPVTAAVRPTFCYEGTTNCPSFGLTIGAESARLATGDFNSDGYMDVAMFQATGVAILLGDGSGKLTAGAVLPSTETWVSGIAAGDFDEDGNVDLAVYGNLKITLFHGNGDGTFTAGSVISFAASWGAYSLIAADFNGDGHLDLAAQVRTGSSLNSAVQAFLGDGAGHFTAAAPLEFPGDYVVPTSPMVVGDVDGDGFLDLVFTVNPGTVIVAKGDGVGGFTQGWTYAAGNNSSGGDQLGIGDFNGDGYLDLAVGNLHQNVVKILLGDGFGTFTLSPASPLTNTLAQNRALKIADVDGDGNLDVVTLGFHDLLSSFPPQSISVFYGDGSGGFSSAIARDSLDSYVSDYALVDLNGDGRLDFVYQGRPNFSNLKVFSILQYPVGSLSATFYSFGDQRYLTPSTPYVVTVSAGGTAPLILSSIGTTGDPDFQVAGGTCSAGTPIPAGTTCTIEVTFTPQAAGARNGALSVVDNSYLQSGGVAHGVTFAGADSPQPLETYSSNLGPVVMGTENLVPVTFQNTGTGPFALSFEFTFDFQSVHVRIDPGTCPVNPAPLVPGASCIYNVHVTSQARGPAVFQFLVYEHPPVFQAYGIALHSGFLVGYSGAGGISPATLTFQATNINTSSAVQSVTLTNTATSPLLIYGISSTDWRGASPDFLIANTSTCPTGASTLAPSASCRIDVIFKPTKKGPLSATLSIDDTALGGSPQHVDMSGVGVANPLPFVSTPLVPSAISPGGGSNVPLVVRGAGFVAGAVVRFNGTPLATTFINVDQLAATIPAALLVNARTAHVTVFNPGPGGGVSNVADLPIASTVASPSLSRRDVTVGAAPQALATGDFNGDGMPDIAVAICGSDRGTVTPCAAGNVAILLGTGGGNFAAPVIVTLPGSTADGIVAGDFNNDGHLDLVVSHWLSDSITLLLGDGAGNFTASSDSPISLASWAGACSAGALATGDFNGDGTLDLVVVDPVCGQAFVFQGAAGTIDAIPIGSTYVGSAESVAVGDFNGDGNLDVAAPDSGGNLFLATGDGTGTLNYLDPFPGVNAPEGLVIADFNGDRISDIAVADPGTGSVAVFLGNGAAGFLPAVSFAAGNGPRTVSAADVNNDGKVDLVVGNANDDSVIILLGDGTGAFAPSGAPLAVGARPMGLVIADLDGDGRLDIVTVNRNDTTVSVLQQNSSTATMISAPPIVYGANGVVTVSVSGPSGVVSGTVSLTVDAGAPLSMALTNGTAVFSVSMPSGGSHSLSASFAAQNGLLASSNIGTLQVGKATTVTALKSNTPNPATPGQMVTVTFSVAGPPTPPGSVTVNASTGETCSGVLSSGRGSCSMTFSTTGMRTLIASYAGNGNFKASASAPVVENVNGPLALLTPASADFGRVYLDSKTSRTFALKNVGNAPLKITDIAIAAPGNALADFTRTHTCPPTLAAGAACTITVTLDPRAVNLRTATLRVTDNANGSPHTAALSAIVVNPKANLAPDKIDFPKQKAGTASAPKTMTLTNTGTTVLTLGAVGVRGEFAIVAGTTCAAGTTLAAGASCRINVTFQPAAKGARTGTLTVTDDAKNSPQTASLTGSGS